MGFRSGCRNSLIPANGVLNAPNFAFGCICSYSIFTSLALVHVPDSDMWTYSAQKAGDGPVQRLGINIGALGDRQADDGTLWLDYPNVGGSSPSVPVKIVTDAPKWFRLPSTQLSGDGLKWVAACGVTGIKTVKIPTVVGKAKATEKSYTVRLYFTEPDNSEPGQRIFDVRIQGRMAIQNLDVAKEAGGRQRVLVKDVRGIKTNRELTISFAPRIGRALISGVEIVAEVN